MKKDEVLKLSKKARKAGYTTYDGLLWLWEDDEEIPEEYIKVIIQKPETKKPFLICGKNLHDKLNKTCKDFVYD